MEPVPASLPPPRPPGNSQKFLILVLLILSVFSFMVRAFWLLTLQLVLFKESLH